MEYEKMRYLTAAAALALSITPIAFSGTGEGPKWLYYLRYDAESIYRMNTETLRTQPVKFNLKPVGTGDYTTNWAIATDGCKIYWTTERRILRCSMDGSHTEVVYNGGNSAVVQALAIDSAAGKMYWSTGVTGQIKRANLNGTNIETLVTVGKRIFAIALDPAGGKMYWTAPGEWILGPGPGIQRANLDGSNVETIATMSINDVPSDQRVGIALDLAAQKVYWTDCLDENCELTVIRRANLDGSNAEDFLTDLPRATNLIVDSDTGKVYWNERVPLNWQIRRANTDGTQVETCALFSTAHGFCFVPADVDTQCGGPPNPCPPEMKCNLEAIYKTANSTLGAQVWRCNGDGSDLIPILETPDKGWLGEPISIGAMTLDKGLGKVYWTSEFYCPDGECQVGEPAWEVYRANLDGSDIEYLVNLPIVSNSVIVNSVGLDVPGGKMYFGREDYHPLFPTFPARIYRANLDGSGIEEYIVFNSFLLGGLKVDVQNRKIYFGHEGALQVANLDGPPNPTIVVDTDFDPRRIDIDLTNSKIYWTEKIMGQPAIDTVVRRANFDGTSVETVGASDGASPCVAVHPPSGRVYRGMRIPHTASFYGNNFIAQSNLDGNSGMFCIAYSTGHGIPDMALLFDDPALGHPVDINGDGVVNVIDLLTVISAWGPCAAPPQNCAADVAPQPNGDGVVNVADLLMIINNWG
jgi:hypothetical protein